MFWHVESTSRDSSIGNAVRIKLIFDLITIGQSFEELFESESGILLLFKQIRQSVSIPELGKALSPSGRIEHREELIGGYEHRFVFLAFQKLGFLLEFVLVQFLGKFSQINDSAKAVLLGGGLCSRIT